ncbi:unnamed protein product [Brachionus calyciflorus]|uniref:RZ-type domain-containing protein n=1 Tax=Brachionus calyciflorus TaxID=104777 RepID=A0A813M0K9_9BILA|nr:unnamed protein product [Brachionus calyciflorus]
MEKGLKCPLCQLIQLKGSRCSLDGTLLVECDLKNENLEQNGKIFDSNNNREVLNIKDEMVTESCGSEHIQSLDTKEDMTIDEASMSFDENFHKNQFCENVLKMANLKSERFCQKPVSYQICNLKVVVPSEYFKNNQNLNLHICFLYNDCQQRALLFYEPYVKHHRHEKLEYIKFSVYFPQELVDYQVKYFYYLVEQTQHENLVYPEFNFMQYGQVRFLDTKPNKYSQNHVDGLVLFSDENIAKINKKHLKEKTLNIFVNEPMKILWDREFLNKQHIFLSMLNKIYESLCSDQEYFHSFQNILENEFMQITRELGKNKDKNELDNITALTIFYCCFNYKLKMFTDVKQMQTLIRAMENKDINFVKNIFQNFFKNFDQLTVICDSFRNFLETSVHNPIAESIVIAFYYFFALETCDQRQFYSYIETDNSDYANQFRFNLIVHEVLKFQPIFQNLILSEKQINGYVNHLKPLIMNKKEISVIFIHFFGFANQKNLDTLLNSKTVSINIYFEYLNFASVALLDSTERLFRAYQRTVNQKILKNLIQICTAYFFSKQIDNRYYDLTKKNYYTEVYLLKYFVDNHIHECDFVIDLIHLSIVGYQQLAKTPEQWEKLNTRQSLTDELAYLKDIIEDWLNEEFQCSIVENYGFTSSSPSKSQNPFEQLLEGNLKFKLINRHEPFIFDKLLSLEIPSDDFNYQNTFILDKKHYQDLILKHLQQRLKNGSFEQLVKISSAFNFDQLTNKKLIHDEFDKFIIKSLRCDFKLIKKLNELLFGQAVLEKFMDKLLDQEFQIKQDPCFIALQSDLYHLICELYWKDANTNSTLLSKKWKDEFEKIFIAYKEMIQQVINGDVEIYKIKLLNSNMENFERLSQIIFSNLVQTDDYHRHAKYFEKLKNLINFRLFEWQTFQQYHTVVKEFLKFCAKSNNFSYGNFKNLLDNLTKTNLDATKLNQFCIPEKFENLSDKSQVKINAFPNIGIKEFEQMNKICSLDRLKCVLLNCFYERHCNYKCELKQVLDDVLPKTLKEWEQLANIINNGTIKLIDIDNLLMNNFNNKVSNILSELFYIIEQFKIPNINLRNTQLEVYFKFRNSHKTALSIRKICQVYGIRTQFAELNDILNINTNAFKEWNLLKMDDNMRRLTLTLEKYSKTENIQVLEAFAESVELTKWIKTNTKDLKELKFFVDLVSLTKSSEFQHSTGKDVFAKTLKEACIGYAPLIYELDQYIDFNRFIDLCNKVWNNLQNDQKIAEKLKAVKDNVAFLEDVKVKRGNVELSSIEQARQLNEKGVFHIKFNDSQQINFQNVIELNIEMINQVSKEIKSEKFTYEKLNDLKSILMLVAKKSSDEIDNAEREESETLNYFISIFDNVVRLADIYVKLLNNGCDLFNNFEAKIYADCNDIRLKERKPLIEVKLNAKMTIIDNQEPCLKLLKDLCVKMEHSFDTWSNYVNALRDEYYFINYFTIKQIILLKSSLNSVLLTGQINQDKFDLISSLLFNIRTDLDLNNFIPMLNEIIRQTKSKKFMSIGAKSKVKKFNEINDKIYKFAKENNYNVYIVKEAYDKYGNFDEDTLAYCFERDQIGFDENDVLDDVEDAMDIDENFESIKNFGKKIEFLFDDFMVKQNHSDSLSLERLAIFLEYLNQSKKESHTFKRNPPGYLHRGKPNLIMCSQQRDQIPIVLSFYGHTFDAPLPTNDEVLFCNSDTTAEEVENFFRIAFKSNGDKIYTLINVQELTYENSSKVERFLSSNTNIKQSDNYILVCTCSTERPEQSLITSSIIKNRVVPIPLSSELIEEYLQKKLTTNSKNSLAFFDLHKSSIRVLLSQRAGNGKSLYVETFKKSVPHFEQNFEHKIIRIKTNILNLDSVLNQLFTYKTNVRTLYHIDIAYETFSNVDLFIFNLAILNCLTHSNGQVWRRSPNDLYFIEMMPPFIKHRTAQSYHATLNYLPRITFRNPKKYLYDLINSSHLKYHDELFSNFCLLKKFQRSANYLKLFAESPDRLINYTFDASRDRLNEITCLKILLEYSGLNSPNWADLHSFVNFLDNQLEVLETARLIREVPYLKNVCGRFLILMAKDFGIPSLNLGDGSDVVSLGSDNRVEIQLDRLEIARNWENMTHPYILFNNDRETFTFMGIYLDRRQYKFINPNNGQIIQSVQINLDANTRIALLQQRIPIYDNFNDYPRTKKVNALRIVMGLDFGDLQNYDPDPTYELTLDNCLKLMAIFMRLRCNNPVVVMGETGCGKTRKLKFYSDLHVSPRKRNDVKHLIHFKVHGGTTYEEIERKVEQAEQLARLNYQRLFDNSKRNYRDTPPATAILFIDEANTTDAIGLIKEIMCDLTCNGRRIDFEHGLKIVAAVNPYRKHSDEMIRKLEEAGLGFYISANDSKEKIGHIPMRQLVYRVQPLPASMLPLVWDFETENVYILQMIKRASKQGALPNINELDSNELSQLLTQSQRFMRSSNDECSFVSLRDVERVIKVTTWFLSKQNLLFDKMKNKKLEICPKDDYQNYIPDLKRAFILALAVCYHSSLYNMETRFRYRKLIADYAQINFGLSYSRQFDWVLYEILKCQFVFLDEMELANNIARNQALLENVFMIIICLELRIPLFIVGKPGSSKSLAKSIVESSMHGQNSKSDLFKNLKETYFLNFQCSPLTRSEMIIKTFQEAANFQRDSDLDKFVSIVNLDEVGLAEASESMPLKVLHPLLEDGSDSSDDQVEAYQKVAVIGISNWALDPAKMNRGIFVSRSEPDTRELIESAKGICKYDLNIYNTIHPFIEDIAKAYLKVCELAKNHKREFFGLRDYYSLIKMIYWFCTRDGCLTWNKLEHSVRRNFGGLDLDMVKPFKDLLFSKLDQRELPTDPKCGSIDLIKAALKGENVDSNSRYLLLLTENYTVIDIIQNYLINSLKTPAHKVVVIFGSSFKHDLEYTEVCKNISKIKHSMEVGNTVILLNFQNLFESLYDALNQYYQVFGGQRYVYLGINTQRVNCVVHEDFRMIILSDKESVYDSKRFPIPLINRLEKHFLNSSTMLHESQLKICTELGDWLKKFTSLEMGTKLNEIFIGYHDDALASIVLYLIQDGNVDYFKENDDNQQMDTDKYESVLTEAKSILLQCSTLDNILRAINKNVIDSQYLSQNTQHYNLMSLLRHKLRPNYSSDFNKNLLQVSSHSNFSVTRQTLRHIAESLNLDSSNLSSCLLKSFDTQNQFSNRVKQFLTSQTKGLKLLVIQADFTKRFESDLLSCTKNAIVEQLKETLSSDPKVLESCFIVLFINFPREFSKKFIGFQVSQWSCYHVDELDDTLDYLPSLENLKSKSLSRILNESLNGNGINLENFLKILSNQSCSMIQDTNISRTIQRVSIFNTLCNSRVFLEAIISRLVRLQEEKEREVGGKSISEGWFFREVVKFKRINEYSTLKKSCQNYLETKLSPLLAFLLSKIDLFSNLNILVENPNNWKTKLFLDILNSPEFLKISYSEMRNTESNQEINEFYCRSELFEKKFYSNSTEVLRSNLPFFWIIVQQLNDFSLNYLDGVSNLIDEDQKMHYFINTIPGLFEETVFYKVFKKTIDSNKLTQTVDLFDLYLSDFVLVNCKCRLNEEVQVIKKAVKKSFSLYIEESDIRLSFPLVHLVFESLKPRNELYLKFSSFNPMINTKLLSMNTFENIDLDSCINAIDLFSREQEKLENLEKSSKKLEKLLNLIRSVIILAKDRSNLEQYENIVQKYDSFKLLLLLMVDVCDQNLDLLQDIYSDLITMMKLLILKNNLNFKKRRSIELVSEFLIKCVDKARTVCFSQSSVSKCCNQKCAHFKKLNTQDCQCFICSDCEIVVRSKLTGNRVVCRVCRKQVNVQIINNQISTSLTEIRQFKDPYEKFIQKLNLFYYNIINTLIFKSNDSIPDADLIESILRIATQGKIYAENSFYLDSRIRSLILQLIFRNYTMSSDYFNKWFANTETDMRNNIDMALTFISCVEEANTNELINKNLDEQIQVADNICQVLLNNFNQLNLILNNQTKRLDIESLAYLAKLKFCLKTLAKVTYSQEKLESIKNKPLFDSYNYKMQKLIEPSLQITDIVFNFLVKEFIRKFSFTSVKYILSNPNLKWMMPKKIIGDKINVSDRYVLIGERYIQLKRAITDGFQNRNAVLLQTILEKDADRLFPYVAICLYKNVTLLNKEVDNVPIDIFLPTITKAFGDRRSVWTSIITNELSHKLKINKNNCDTIEFNLLILQLKFSILYSKSKLIRPLANLIESPKDFKQSFIPCMPQDSIFDMLNAVRQSGRNENPTLYACPNGHPYILFDCGRPWVVMKCSTCNENIGGTQHTLLPRNTRLDNQDRTIRGYCLPVPISINHDFANERLLNAASFHILRFIINCVMYFACDTNQEHVYNMMTCRPNDLKQFFWDYMQKDLRIISKALNLNTDEATILLHLISDDILKNITSSSNLFDKWQSKDERTKYEREFYENYIEHKLKNCGKLIGEATKKLKEEDKQNDEESQRLYFMAYELINENTNRASYLYEKFDFWKYQPICDFNVFKIEIEFTDSNDYKLLKLIVENEHKLKYVKKLSEIMKLVNFIHKNYFKQFHKHTVSNMDLKEALAKGIFSKSFNKENLNSCVRAFQEVWFNSKQYLPNYVREKLPEISVINIQNDFKFDLDTKLSYFLPTKTGDGHLTYAIIHYLVNGQNEILKSFHKHDEVLSVDINLIEDNEYLIEFDPYDDFLRIIKSNFIFDSKESRYWFQYDSIHDRVVETYIRNKPLIETKIPLFQYSDEINDNNLFSKLNAVIPQETIDTSLQSKIFNDLETIEQTADALNILKILINYAKTTASDSDEFIRDLIKKVYIERNVETILKSNIIEQCQLKHLHNIWILLMMKKAFLNTVNNMNAFENLNDRFKEPKEIDLNVALDPLKTLSLSFVVYQLINYCSNITSDEDIDLTARQKIQDLFYTLDNMNILNSGDADRLCSFVTPDEAMKNIYSVWLKLTIFIQKFSQD